MAEKTTSVLYEDAKQRALARDAKGKEFLAQSMEGFAAGVMVADFKNREWWSEEGYDPDYLDELRGRIQTETNYAFCFVLGVLAKLEAVKGKAHLASWQKRGEPEVLASIQRKFDRLDAIISLGETGGDETLTQNLAALSVYALKMVTLRAETTPDEFKSWVQEVQGL